MNKRLTKRRPLCAHLKTAFEMKLSQQYLDRILKQPNIPQEKQQHLKTLTSTELGPTTYKFNIMETKEKTP